MRKELLEKVRKKTIGCLFNLVPVVAVNVKNDSILILLRSQVIYRR